MKEKVKIEIKNPTKKEKVFDFFKFLIKNIIRTVVISCIFSIIIYINSCIFMDEHVLIKSQILQISAYVEYCNVIISFTFIASFIYLFLSTANYIYQEKFY